MIIHNVKVAVRNLMKYKLQTLISVLSIAIGIVTLSLAYSVMTRFRLPAIYSEPYHDRAYKIYFKGEVGDDDIRINGDIIRAMKRDGGLRCAEQIAVPNGIQDGCLAEFHSTDSVVRKGQISATFIDPEYANYAGFHSAVTGKKIRKLKPGEAIIGERLAKRVFRDKNPIGAIQTNTNEHQIIPVTIVDVYQSRSLFDQLHTDDMFYFCVTDSIEDYNQDGFYAIWINVVLKEGCTTKQLQEEVNGRVKPLGLRAKLSTELNDDDINIYITINVLVHIISSLILLAAIIGFLRIQTQLFWIRRHEVSLRVVNGASRMQLFGLLVTEVFITICLSIILAVGLGILLQDFINVNMNIIMEESGIIVRNLWLYSLVTGGGLLVICCMIVWITIVRICKAGQGLATSMRRSRNHLFRNVMLGIQIAISMVFVSGTFILTNGVDKIVKACNIPDNDDFYKEWLLLRPGYADKPQQLVDEIKRLPDLDRIIKFDAGYFPVDEVKGNPEVMEKLQGDYFLTYSIEDTTALSFLSVDVEWFNRDIDRNRCLFLSKKLYNKFRGVGILDKNTLSKDGSVLPIAGIVKNIPYNIRDESMLIISSDWITWSSDYILVPKAGRSKALARSVDETIERTEPECINKMIFNFRTIQNPSILILQNARTGGWILGGVSLLICAMSIFSTIALDTRARKNEVAIRKINGAKGKNIYRMFGMVYVALIVIAVIIAIPVCLSFNMVIETVLAEAFKGNALSPVMPIALGIAVVTLLIFLIVGWQIHRVMQVDPAEIIAKD